jgi:hypothetical protein
MSDTRNSIGWMANLTYGQLHHGFAETVTVRHAPPRTELTNNEIVILFIGHEDAVNDIWVEDDENTMRYAVEEWLARQLINPLTTDDL